MTLERITGSTPGKMLTSTGARMRWSVLWMKGDTIMRRRCGMNLAEAARIFSIAERAGREDVTLRCDNFGFPPPEKFHPHAAYKITYEEYKTPKGKKKKREIRELVQVVPMMGANKRGIYWCPYCQKFRHFQMQPGFYFEGRYVPDGDRRGGIYCPMCGISHRDQHVRRWNPIADRHYLSA